MAYPIPHRDLVSEKRYYALWSAWELCNHRMQYGQKGDYLARLVKGTLILRNEMYKMSFDKGVI